jgi:hypothetical protein
MIFGLLKIRVFDLKIIQKHMQVESCFIYLCLGELWVLKL